MWIAFRSYSSGERSQNYAKQRFMSVFIDRRTQTPHSHSCSHYPLLRQTAKKGAKQFAWSKSVFLFAMIIFRYSDLELKSPRHGKYLALQVVCLFSTLVSFYLIPLQRICLHVARYTSGPPRRGRPLAKTETSAWELPGRQGFPSLTPFTNCLKR